MAIWWWIWVSLVLDLGHNFDHHGLHLGHLLLEGFDLRFYLLHWAWTFFGITLESVCSWITGPRQFGLLRLLFGHNLKFDESPFRIHSDRLAGQNFIYCLCPITSQDMKPNVVNDY